MSDLWTCGEEIRFRQAIDEGLSRNELCVAMGRGFEALRRKAHRMGLKLPAEPRKRSTFNYQDRTREPSKKATILSTAALGKAINALIAKMPANDVAIMLGKPHLCTPDRPAPYGTASALRDLAA